MSCKSFEMFDKYTEEELVKISSFLFEYGRALSMSLTGMNKEEWLKYHKDNMPEDALSRFEEPWKEAAIEELPAWINPDTSVLAGLDFFEALEASTTMGIARDIAKFRLQEGF